MSSEGKIMREGVLSSGRKGSVANTRRAHGRRGFSGVRKKRGKPDTISKLHWIRHWRTKRSEEGRSREPKRRTARRKPRAKRKRYIWEKRLEGPNLAEVKYRRGNQRSVLGKRSRRGETGRKSESLGGGEVWW